MFVQEYKGRRYYVCNECKKPYSFKAGKMIRPGMERYCRHCAPKLYPYMSGKGTKG